MKMIRYEDVGVDLPARLDARLAQRLDETLPVRVVPEDRLALVTAILDSQLARHASTLKIEVANDLALLKAEGRFAALPVAASRWVKLGGTVAAVGFPNIGLQGFAPKLAKGEIASPSGVGDDARYFQISVPVQLGTLESKL